MTGAFDVGDAFYERRCSMNRSSWEYVESKSYSIVTEVIMNNDIIFSLFSNFFVIVRKIVRITSTCILLRTNNIDQIKI